MWVYYFSSEGMSYSCMNNIKKIINKHNFKIPKENYDIQNDRCNCRDGATCHFNHNSLINYIPWRKKITTITTTTKHTLVSLNCKNSFNHILSFNNGYSNSFNIIQKFWAYKCWNRQSCHYKMRYHKTKNKTKQNKKTCKQTDEVTLTVGCVWRKSYAYWNMLKTICWTKQNITKQKNSIYV